LIVTAIYVSNYEILRSSCWIASLTNINCAAIFFLRTIHFICTWTSF